jgi:hypothetical protein
MIEPGSQEWKDRIDAFVRDEQRSPERLYYMSFVDEDNDRFLGAIVTRAHGPATALLKVNQLRINPGGQVVTIQMPEAPPIDPSVCDRLLTREEVVAAFGPCQTLGEFENEEA